jgi:hypothetical protein
MARVATLVDARDGVQFDARSGWIENSRRHDEVRLHESRTRNLVPNTRIRDRRRLVRRCGSRVGTGGGLRSHGSSNCQLFWAWAHRFGVQT